MVGVYDFDTHLGEGVIRFSFEKVGFFRHGHILVKHSLIFDPACCNRHDREFFVWELMSSITKYYINTTCVVSITSFR